jgi:hypothetical protein
MRKKLPKGYKLPANFKAPWFSKMPKSSQRAYMHADLEGETRARNASKRDIETYAESAENRRINLAKTED